MLRGVNLGSVRRVPMAELRVLLGDRGFGEVATHGQSGNIALGADEAPDAVAERVAGLIEQRFGLTVPVAARTHEELRAVCAHDPLAGGAEDPKRYQVTFLDAPPDPATIDRLAGLATGTERLAAHGRELYSHHPDGIARSRLAAQLTAPSLGANATARNWATVTKLLELTAS